MLQLQVDRDSVAMGDDVEGHEERWRMPDDAPLGQVIIRAVENHYLPSVAGEVAWTLRDGAGRVLALIVIDGTVQPRVSRVNSITHMGLPQRIDWACEPGDDGAYVFVFRYHSGGRALDWGEFREWVTPRHTGGIYPPDRVVAAPQESQPPHRWWRRLSAR